MPNIVGTSVAGFLDASLWERVKKQGDTEIKGLIREGLKNTSVTVVCITFGTAQRKYVKYEIEQSLERGNGLVGIQIHHLTDPSFPEQRVGSNPPGIEDNGFKIYKYTNKEALARQIDEAYNLS